MRPTCPSLLLPVLSLLASAAFGQTPPTPVIQFVANNGSSQKGFSPGTLVNIFGQNLGPGSAVTVGGRACSVRTSSARQLNVQFPVDLPPGPANLVIELQSVRSAPFNLRIDPVSPAIFTFGAGLENELGRFLRANGSTVSVQNPPIPGETISFLGTGMGPTTPPLVTGQPAPAGARLVNTASLRLGGRTVPIVFAGAAAGSVGINQVVFTIPGDFTSGSYAVIVTVAGTNSNTVTLPIAVTGLVLSQSGFTFQAVAGGSVPAARSVRILNGTQQTADYTSAVTTFSGSGWLSTSPDSGSIPPSGSTAVAVSVNPAGLSPGDYYAQIRIDATGVPNSPQFLSVVLNVVAPNLNPGPTVDPSGLVFVGVLGAPDPAGAPVRITNLLTRATRFTATASFLGGRSFFTFTPASGSVTPGQPFTINVAPVLQGLPAEVYRGAVTLQFPDDNTSRVVDVLLVVTPQIPAAADRTALDSLASLPVRAADGACTPARLLPVFTTLGASFNAAVAWPSNIELTVVDNCGGPMSAGSVDVAFSNGDPPLSLLSLQQGRWSATWTPRNARTAAFRVTATARDPARALEGTTELGGTVQANEGVPAINANGAVSAGSYSASAAPSPGELVSIFGLRLADGLQAADSLPLPGRLQGTTVVLSGRVLPLVFVSDAQINAVVPYDVAAGTTHQLIVRRGNRVSVPESLAVQLAQPAIFSTDLSGKGQGHIYIARALADPVPANASNPAKGGDVLVAYCTGLGAVTPATVAGEATPADALRMTAQRVSVTIGGVTAPVSFAGLTPGFTGLYQVNLTVPPGVPPGDEVPVVVTVAGISSPPVTIAVR